MENLRSTLTALAGTLIQRITRGSPTINEGTVMTLGPQPYRRLDCDGRALAYIRPRPRRRAVRIDVSGLWVAPRASNLSIPNAGGSATLLVRSMRDLSEAVKFLRETVTTTRSVERGLK